MWIDTRGQQHRVYWRTGLPSPQKAYEPFPSRDQAELFKELARRSGTLQGALAYVRDPQPRVLRQLLGMAPCRRRRGLRRPARPGPPRSPPVCPPWG